MILPYSEYHRKVRGCWLGKSAGGTLGGPYEGQPGPLSLSYYDPIPEKMLPNDDLDLQVAWLQILRRRGLPVNRRDLADAWLENIHLWPDEYGVACRNLLQGIYPPASGAWSNKFTDGMGAAIRTEIWACLAPGDPDLAVRLAEEDACVDHTGDGYHAARFLTALESLAFVETDRESLLDQALAYIPEDCRLSLGLRDTRAWWAKTGDWTTVRDQILAAHAPQNWTDVVPNIAFTILGWLDGDGDFGRSLCTAVNCGWDTDCSGATLGSILGILDPEGIPDRWLQPLGDELVLSPGMVGMHHPATLSEFSQQVEETAVNVQAFYGSTVRITGSPWQANTLPRQGSSPARFALGSPAAHNESLVALTPLTVTWVYPDTIALQPNQTHACRLRLGNPCESPIQGTLRLAVPDRYAVSPGSLPLGLEPGACAEWEISITTPATDAPRSYRNLLDLQFEVGGLRWGECVGLPATLPWRRTSGNDSASAESIEALAHFQPIPAGPQRLEARIKVPFRGEFMVVTQGTRPAKTYLNDELVNEFAGAYYVPAIHRSRTASKVRLDRGWCDVRIDVEDGPAGELFFTLGVPGLFCWVHELEWSTP